MDRFPPPSTYSRLSRRRAGTDTDAVAAIAGALLRARRGCSGIPLEGQQDVNGRPA
ncbi:ADP-ribosylglycohydrolase family protein [Streptomyces sp. NBC_00510]